MTSAEIKKLDGERVMHTYGRFDVAIEKGEDDPDLPIAEY